MGGCDKIASKFRSKTKTQPAKKERAARRAPQGTSVPGPKLAIILDDMGNDKEAAAAAFALHYPLTISVLPYHAYSTEIAAEAQRQGLGGMTQLPMRATAHGTPGAQQLAAGLSIEAVGPEA